MANNSMFFSNTGSRYCVACQARANFCRMSAHLGLKARSKKAARINRQTVLGIENKQRVYRCKPPYAKRNQAANRQIIKARNL